MHTCMQKPRPGTPTRIGGTTVPEHAKHEKRWVKREPRKYVTCHAAHAGKTTNKGGQRGVWSIYNMGVWDKALAACAGLWTTTRPPVTNIR